MKNTVKALNSKVLVASAVVALGLGTAAVTFAGDHGKGCGWGKRGGDHHSEGRGYSERHGGYRGNFSLADRMQNKLDLTDEQVAQIDEITDAQYKAMRDFKRSKRDQQQAMLQLDPANANFDAEVARLAAQAGERTEAMLKLRAETRAKLAAVLTPEQQEKMKELKQSMQEKGQGRFFEG
ncbi:MAG: Spy/CpxP family protein refolding chaperone [Marinobacterium sp.]|nr:Spy/CpxP family protein refolding chaperone [Marinobacterium sp.]